MAVAVGMTTIGVEYVFRVMLSMIRLAVDRVTRAIRRLCMPCLIASGNRVMLAEPGHNRLAGQQRQNAYGYCATEFKHCLEDGSFNSFMTTDRSTSV